MEWSRGTTGHAKYRVRLPDGRVVQFGDTRYQHFRDRTPLRLYSHLDHGDAERRRRYRLRHGAQGHHLKKHSPAWFAWHYLW